MRLCADTLQHAADQLKEFFVEEGERQGSIDLAFRDFDKRTGGELRVRALQEMLEEANQLAATCRRRFMLLQARVSLRNARERKSKKVAGGGNNKGGMMGSTNSKFTGGNSTVERGEKKNMEKTSEMGGGAPSVGENNSFRNNTGDTYKSMGEKSMSVQSMGGLSSMGRNAPVPGLRHQFSKTLPTPGKAKGQGLGRPNVSLRNLGKVRVGPLNIPLNIPSQYDPFDNTLVNNTPSLTTPPYLTTPSLLDNTHHC